MIITLESKLLENWAQILAIFIVSLSMLNYGLLFGWLSPAIEILTSGQNDFQITDNEASYLSVLPPIATILVALPVGHLINQIGRKNTLLFGTTPYFIAWILIAIGGSKWIFYTARFITGIGDACAISTCSLYVGEIAIPKVRGKWGNLLVLTLFLGILLAYILGGYLDMKMNAYICIVVPILQFMLLCTVPESPYYLIIKKQHEAAKRSLQWLRQRQDVDAEFATISAAVQRQMEETGSYRDIIFISSNLKALIVVVMIRLVNQFSGMSAFIVYAQTIFERSGGGMTSTTSAIICASIQLVFSVGGAMIVDKFGRRRTLFNSAISSSVVLILMAVYFYLESNTNVDVSMLNWFPLAGMVLYLIVFSLGLSVVPTLMSGELFSASVKEKSMSINTIIIAALIAGTTKIFQVLSEVGLFVPFAFYACSTAVLTLVCYFIVPETKGKTLDEIQQGFQQDKEKQQV